MISSSALIALLIQLVIFGLIMWVLWWGLAKIGLPEPFAKIATVVLVIITVLFLVNILLGLGGHPLVRY
jgi:hypothetical protein